MKCLLKYKWVKLPRNLIQNNKGLMAYYLKLASRTAFRKGISHYYIHSNEVEPGMWAGGMVGLKSILGIKKRKMALWVMDRLQELGYIAYTLDAKTKKLTYRITHWVLKCSGAACMTGAVCVTDGYGFLCIPRTITEKLAEERLVFDETAAWLDLWCHTVYADYGNAFSFLAPAVQYGKYGAVLTLETLGKRWGWEKTKVWRFFRDNADIFRLYRLPGSYGCVIYNCAYPVGGDLVMPEEKNVVSIFHDILTSAACTHTVGTNNERLNRFVAWKSRKLMKRLWEKCAKNESEEERDSQNDSGSRVADLDPITRAYFSHGRNCKTDRKCIYDCQGKFTGKTVNLLTFDIGALYPFFPNPYFYDDS